MNLQKLSEKFDPFNLNVNNPLKDIDLNKICYFDVETTGLHPSNSQIVEIAAKIGDTSFYRKILLTDETKQKIAQQNKKPKIEGSKTIEDLLNQSSYFDEENKPSSNELNALLAFKSFAKQADFLLAHNASFDMKMVNSRLKQYGELPLLKVPVLDTLMFSRRFFIPTLVALEETSLDQQEKQRAKQILDQLTKLYYDSGQRKKIASDLGSLSKSMLGQIQGWHQAMADVETLKALVEQFFKIAMDKFLSEDPSQDIRSNPTFKKYYIRNRRFEKFIKDKDKKRKK